MDRPLSVTAILVLSWIRIALFVFMVVFVINAASGIPEGEALRGFRAGALESLGYNPENFGAEHAGEVTGGLFFTLIPLLFVLYAVRKRKLLMLRIAVAVDVLFCLVSGLPIIQVIVAVLAFVPNTANYFAYEEDALVL